MDFPQRCGQDFYPNFQKYQNFNFLLKNDLVNVHTLAMIAIFLFEIILTPAAPQAANPVVDGNPAAESKDTDR